MKKTVDAVQLQRAIRAKLSEKYAKQPLGGKMAKPAKKITPKLSAILKKFAAALEERYGNRYVGLRLYGSQARGEATSESDVDLVLVLRGVNRPTREIDRISDLIADVNLRYGVLLSVVPVDEEILKNSVGPFWRNVRREGVAA